MTTVFTEHIAALSSGADPISDQVMDQVKIELRKVLRARGLLEQSPTILGYLGASWNDSGAIDDLVSDCYVRAIAKKLPGLKRCFAQSGSIDGIVVRNIKNFVWEQQKRANPVGHAVFQNSKQAAMALVENGQLICSSPASKVVGETEFRFEQAGSPATVEELKTAIDQAGISEIEQLAKVGESAQTQLAEVLASLSALGISGFNLKSLKDALLLLCKQSGIEDSHSRAFSDFHDEFAENVRTADQQGGYEQEESLRGLFDSAKREIDSLPRSEQVKKRLKRLLDHFQTGADADDQNAKQTVDDLAAKFEVGRSTIHEDRVFLGKLVERYVRGGNGDPNA